MIWIESPDLVSMIELIAPAGPSGMSTRILSPFTLVVVAELSCWPSILDSMTQSAEAVEIKIADAARQARNAFMGGESRHDEACREAKSGNPEGGTSKIPLTNPATLVCLAPPS